MTHAHTKVGHGEQTFAMNLEIGKNFLKVGCKYIWLGERGPCSAPPPPSLLLSCLDAREPGNGDIWDTVLLIQTNFLHFLGLMVTKLFCVPVENKWIIF